MQYNSREVTIVVSQTTPLEELLFNTTCGIILAMLFFAFAKLFLSIGL